MSIKDYACFKIKFTDKYVTFEPDIKDYLSFYSAYYCDRKWVETYTENYYMAVGYRESKNDYAVVYLKHGSCSGCDLLQALKCLICTENELEYVIEAIESLIEKSNIVDDPRIFFEGKDEANSILKYISFKKLDF